MTQLKRLLLKISTKRINVVTHSQGARVMAVGLVNMDKFSAKDNENTKKSFAIAKGKYALFICRERFICASI